MPVPKKKDTTPTTAETGSETPDFHHHLRTLIRSATRIVMEEVMREELEQFLGAGWGECSPKRKGYRNGTYTRDLTTATGRIEDLAVPRDRAGEFHTQAFERYSRYEPAIAEGLTKMFVSGTSTHKVGEVAQTLMGSTPSASTISRLNHSLTEQFDARRERRLQPHWRILYLDGIHFKIRNAREKRHEYHFDSIGGRFGGQQRGVGPSRLCRGGQRRVAEFTARSAQARSYTTRSDRDGWT